jgi:hypothetical protein
MGLASQALTDFSSGWSFQMNVNPGSLVSQFGNCPLLPNTTFTGATGGNVSAVSTNNNFLQALDGAASAPYTVYGSHDSGTTFVPIASGTLTVALT